MCRPNSSSCGLSFRFAGVVRVGPRYFFGLRRTTGRRFCDASAAWRAARWPQSRIILALKLNGEENDRTLLAANNYASSLAELKRFEEAKTLLRKTMPVARCVVGGSHELALSMSALYTKALYTDEGATLDDVREAVTTLEETERTARRVMGGAHPLTVDIEDELRDARAALRARETPPPA